MITYPTDPPLPDYYLRLHRAGCPVCGQVVTRPTTRLQSPLAERVRAALAVERLMRGRGEVGRRGWTRKDQPSRAVVLRGRGIRRTP